MDNWQETREIVVQHGILPIEDIPNDFLDYLWNYANYIIDDGENNKKLVGHIQEEYFYNLILYIFIQGYFLLLYSYKFHMI